MTWTHGPMGWRDEPAAQCLRRLPLRLKRALQLVVTRGVLSLYDWVKHSEIDNGTREGITTAERDQIKALEREVKEIRRANEFLKLASAFFAQAELDRRLKS